MTMRSIFEKHQLDDNLRSTWRGLLAELDSCQRAWKIIDGKKVWFRLVPDPNPDAE